MNDMDAIEAKLRKVQEAKAIEAAVDLAERAIKHEAKVRALVAEDAAESERSVWLAFTVEESAALFRAAIEALKPRLAGIKAEAGA
jgi:hypothetical protein